LIEYYGAFTHTHPGIGWDGLAALHGNSMYFNGGVHTMSYQRSPSHPIPAYVWMHHYAVTCRRYCCPLHILTFRGRWHRNEWL